MVKLQLLVGFFFCKNGGFLKKYDKFQFYNMLLFFSWWRFSKIWWKSRIHVKFAPYLESYPDLGRRNITTNFFCVLCKNYIWASTMYCECIITCLTRIVKNERGQKTFFVPNSSGPNTSLLPLKFMQIIIKYVLNRFLGAFVGQKTFFQNYTARVLKICGVFQQRHIIIMNNYSHKVWDMKQERVALRCFLFDVGEKPPLLVLKHGRPKFCI